MLIVKVILVALVCGAAAGADRAPAEELQPTLLTMPPVTPLDGDRMQMSKTELALRFRDIKNGYSEIKGAVAKYQPLKADAPLALRVARMKIAAAMRSYDISEGQAQKQRDHLNLLVELTPREAMRLKMSMNRLAKMQAAIAALIRTMTEAGDAMAGDEAAAATRQASQYR